MRFTWPALYAILFLYRSFFAFVAFAIVSRFTTLGDTYGYALGTMAGYHDKYGIGFDSNTIAFLFGYAIQVLFLSNEYVSAIAFQAIGFVGIVALLRSLSPDFRRRLVPFFFFPSFTMWTSIPGKETFIVLFVCLVLKVVVDWTTSRRLNLPLLAFGLLMVGLFKPHFVAALLFVLGLALVVSYVRQKGIVVIVAFAVTIGALFALRGFLEERAPQMFLYHFTGDSARSTREPFWTEPGDFFAKAPEGMWLAFVGPTLSEVRISVVHLFSYFESLVMLGAFCAMIGRGFSRIPVFCFFLGLGTIFWILAPNYGTGVMNPGTAIRYRSAWLPIVFFCVAVLMTREFGMAWVERFRKPAAGVRAAPLTPARSA